MITKPNANIDKAKAYKTTEDRSKRRTVIYVFGIEDDAHKGMLKIGMTTAPSPYLYEHRHGKMPDESNNSPYLRRIGFHRVLNISGTAHDMPKLYYSALGYNQYTQNFFTDGTVHHTIKRSGIKKVPSTHKTPGREWYYISPKDAIRAVVATQHGHTYITPTPKQTGTVRLRPEQARFVKDTVKLFKSKSDDNDKMLWNAKMRFGKTLCALSVAKKMKSKHILIITHRPEVDGTWYSWFLRVFKNKLKSYAYSSKNYGSKSVAELKDSHKNFISFASLQDLDGSRYSGNGDEDKDKAIFDTHWDLLIIDEAHEGTQTAITQTLLSHLDFDKKLALSGTPFNLLASKEYKNDQICTWSYTNEQSYKTRWDELDTGNTEVNNPYLTMPKLTIYTFNMGKEAQQKFVNRRTGYFNFHEFFKVNPKTHDFVYKNDVKKFLDYTTAGSTTNNYPYSDFNTRRQIKNTLWVMPSVASANALEPMLKKHPTFDGYKIINVVKDDKNESDETNDTSEQDESALEQVKQGMKDNDYTITLTVRKLTLGVTVPKWSAVVFLSDTLSASQYLQAAFRCQSPYVSKDGSQKKTNCFVFDFSPNRALKIYADTANLNPTSHGNNVSGSLKEAEDSEMKNQCKFMPIISVKGNSMTQYDMDRIDEVLKQNYAEKVVQNGFDCNDLYNDDVLMHLDSDDISTLKAVHQTLMTTPKPPRRLKNLHLGNGDIPTARRASRKKPKHRSPQEKQAMSRVDKMKKARQWAIQCLRPISLRIPFIIYGMKQSDKQELNPSNFTSSIDDSSWKEFMPNGMSKSLFNRCTKFYDIGVFIDAGKEIQQEVKAIDHDTPLTRAMEVAKIFSQFHNPDNETILTPWRTVNRHVGSVFGGLSGFNSHDWKPVKPHMLPSTSTDVFSPDTHILEISARSGLYSLYMVATLYHQALCRRRAKGQTLTSDEEWSLWLKILDNNIFVIAQTPMARDVVIRTLVGYHSQKPKNVWSLADFENNSQAYFAKILNTKVTYSQAMTLDAKASKSIKEQIALSLGNRRKGIEKMKFDAVIGNPPYQKSDNKTGSSASPIYQYFVNLSEKLSSRYVSLIMPAKWYTGGKGLTKFRAQMLNDKHIKTLFDFMTPEAVFPNTHIRGGVTIFLWDRKYDNSTTKAGGKGVKDVHVVNVKGSPGKKVGDVRRPLKVGTLNYFFRDFRVISIMKKIPLDLDLIKYGDSNRAITKIEQKDHAVTNVISPRGAFGISTKFKHSSDFHKTPKGLKDPVRVYASKGSRGYVERKLIPKHQEWIDRDKFYMSRSNNIGTDMNDDNLNVIPATPPSICTDSYIVFGAQLQDTTSVKNLAKYLNTKFARFLMTLNKVSIDASKKVYRYIPMQEFKDDKDINWDKPLDDIDQQLFDKYGLTPDEQNLIRHSIKENTHD